MTEFHFWLNYFFKKKKHQRLSVWRGGKRTAHSTANWECPWQGLCACPSMWNYNPLPQHHSPWPAWTQPDLLRYQQKSPTSSSKTAGGCRWWIGALDLLIPCNSSFLPLQIPSAPGTLSGAKLMLSQPQSSFDCNQGIQYVSLFNTMHVIQWEQIWKYVSWHLYRNGGNCVHNTRTTLWPPVLSASTNDLNETHSATDDRKDDVSSNIFFPFTADVSLAPTVSSSGRSKS